MAGQDPTKSPPRATSSKVFEGDTVTMYAPRPELALRVANFRPSILWVAIFRRFRN
jgi:hypothetical protein